MNIRTRRRSFFFLTIIYFVELQCSMNCTFQSSCLIYLRYRIYREFCPLLEDLSVRPLVGLAVDVDRLVPGPHVVDKLLVLSLGGVELGELVALVVRGDIEGRKSLLATDDECTTDDRVIGDTEDGRATKEVLAAGLETSEETT